MSGLTFAKPMFDWVVLTTPAAAVLIVIVLLFRAFLGNRRDPRLFYVLWLVLAIRMLVPWFPSIEFNLWKALPAVYDTAFHLTGQVAEMHPQSSGRMEPVSMEEQPSVSDWMKIAYIVWLAGVVAAGAFFLAAYGKIHTSLQKRSVPLDRADYFLNIYLERCKEKLGVRSDVTLYRTDLVTSPATFGLFQPRILIPERLVNELDEQEWSCVFMHELTHIRRKDLFWNGCMIGLVILHWFNPLVWKAYFKMREDQELSCDLALKKHIHPVQYGRLLTKMAEIRSRIGRYAIVSFLAVKPNMTKRRIEMLLTKKKTVFSLLVVIAIAIVVAFVFTNPNIGAGAASSADLESAFIAPAEGRITSGFGEETKHYIYAISIANETGTPVYATADGIVQSAGYNRNGGGNEIVIVHSDGYESVYSHLEDILVTEGQNISQGEQIGTIGSTGRSTGPHLAFQLWKDGEPQDPGKFSNFQLTYEK